MIYIILLILIYGLYKKKEDARAETLERIASRLLVTCLIFGVLLISLRGVYTVKYAGASALYTKCEEKLDCDDLDMHLPKDSYTDCIIRSTYEIDSSEAAIGYIDKCLLVILIL